MVYGWHFLRKDWCGPYEPGRPWTTGETRHIAGKIVPCKNGYHASPSAFDALVYAPGPILCYVELKGEITSHNYPTPKWAASSRTLLEAHDVTKELRLFAADCAERVLPLWEEAFPDNGLPRRAIKMVRNYADGTATDEDLANMENAILDASEDLTIIELAGLNYALLLSMAREALHSAMWAAAYPQETWHASLNAAYDAALGIARATSRGPEAFDAEREWQRQRFQELVSPRFATLSDHAQ